ncbi:Core trichothecene cluster (CTC) 12 [Hyphodiscus hymeniophilus]|uniref:Core trichothecene cluster (CTC) 12 n=1 Tax=Hyphodiscus hymeniophilus TaxID=353542 RepID=A0A9P6VFN3_9HELO|nr:Core trichothecene cluster (CTC) 12 [Hyphodiscus hymeniophilus]
MAARSGESNEHDNTIEQSKTEDGADVSQVERATPTTAHIIRLDSYKDDRHINLTWRSWMVVFVTCFAIMAQVFVVVAAGSVIGFIVRDLGDGAISGWIIQGPLLMQSVLSPVVGRLSDVVDRKYLAMVPPMISFIGAVISAKATSMLTLIGGGILVGTTLSTISIVQAIPSEVLPLKFRALANGFAFLGGAVGGVVGSIGAGAATNADPGGWRTIFWIQAGMFAATSLGLLVFYHPPKKSSELPRLSLKSIIWACDPIGTVLFIASATLMLLALDWAGGVYPWHDAHVVAPLTVGLVSLIAFCLYEWKGRDDGLVAHVFFKSGPNFALSVFAFAVEGWIFYSAVNSVTPLVVLNLGFETNSWKISIRQLAYTLVTLIASIPITLYATWKKDLKTPIIVCFVFFLYYLLRDHHPFNGECADRIQCHFWNWSKRTSHTAGSTGPIHVPPRIPLNSYGASFLSSSYRGAFGSAVLDTIINGKISSTYASGVAGAATKAGLPSSSVPALLAAFSSGAGFDTVPGINNVILAAATNASHHLYAAAYRLAWSSIIPFIILALVAIAFMKGVKELMTEHVEATVEHAEVQEKVVV